MKLLIIKENEAGQRLDKYLHKVLKEAPSGFLYKMLRKKNITLNGRKAEGKEHLCPGDEVRFFLSEETFAGFSGETHIPQAELPLSVVYEDRHVLLVDKPVGVLSQPDRSGEPSMTEYVTTYLLKKGDVSAEELQTFRPAVCNRLDRNTSGLIAAGKTLAGLQDLSRLFHDRNLHKYYLCIAEGVMQKEQIVSGYLHKDEKYNKVTVRQSAGQGDAEIHTRYIPLKDNGERTLLKVELITGRSHQIRAHLAAEGHPLLGDLKYNQDPVSRRAAEQLGLTWQLLHSWQWQFPRLSGAVSGLSEKTIEAEIPDYFGRILTQQGLELLEKGRS